MTRDQDIDAAANPHRRGAEVGADTQRVGPDAVGPDGVGIAPRAVAELIASIADGDGALASHILARQHPADAADMLEQASAEQFRSLLNLAPSAFTGPLLSELHDDRREEALAALAPAQIARAVALLDSDDAALLLEGVGEARRAEVLAAVEESDRSILEDALSFDEETAGRLMQREFAAAPEHWTVGDAIDRMRAGADDLPEIFFEIYVLDPTFRPIGGVSLAKLLRRPRHVKLTDVMEPIGVLISPEMDQEDAAYVFRQYHLAQAPVVDEVGRLKGILTVDDMVEVIAEENEEDILALAGVSEGGVAATAFAQVRARAPWLLLNLATAVAASYVISLFEATLQQIVALAILMPIVAALGGNAGTQALAVAVRAIAARDLTPTNAGRMVAREAATALINGVAFALLLALVAGLWFRDGAIAVVIAAAMLTNFICAGLAGILVPLVLRRAGADPAVASSVFVTTTTDVVGFFVFLGLATLVLL